VGFSGSAPAASDGLKAREGMPDLAASVEAGPQVEVMLSERNGYRLELNLPVRRVVAVDSSGPKGIGWVINPSLNLAIRNVGPGVGVGVSGGLWADVGCTTTSGCLPTRPADRPAFRAHGGYSGSALTERDRSASLLWVGMFARQPAGRRGLRGSPARGRTTYIAGRDLQVPFQDLVLSDD
jgi:hypothetical protein